MAKQPISQTVAENLKYYMVKRGLTQASLGKKASLGQTTVGLYLNPDRRKSGKSGKAAAPNLGYIEKLAGALNVEIWHLLRPWSPEDRIAYEQIEAAFKALQPPEVNKDQSDKVVVGNEH